jgi:hypothetical protein
VRGMEKVVVELGNAEVERCSEDVSAVVQPYAHGQNVCGLALWSLCRAGIAPLMS